MGIRAVVFDGGETIIDETQLWALWADWLGIPMLMLFARLILEAGFRPEETAYVGDRIDNDALPARAASLLPIFVHRGPLAYLQPLQRRLPEATIRIAPLADLPAALQRLAAER